MTLNSYCDHFTPRTGFSFLLSPGKHFVECKSFSTLQLDIVGNRSHHSLEQLRDDGVKILEGAPASASSDSASASAPAASDSASASSDSVTAFAPADSVVLEFGDFGFGYKVPPSSGISFSRMSFIDRRKQIFNMFSCHDSYISFTNCFFGAEWKDKLTSSSMVVGLNSNVSMKDCVATRGDLTFYFYKNTKAVIKNCLIESYNVGTCCTHSAVEMENVIFRCHLSLLCASCSKVELKGCMLEEEPWYFTQYGPPDNLTIIDTLESPVTIENSTIGSETFSRGQSIKATDSKLILRRNQFIQKEAYQVIVLDKAVNAIINNNSFHFKKQKRKTLEIVRMDNTTRLEFEENQIQDLDEILKKGINLFDVSMPMEGTMPKSSKELRIIFESGFENKIEQKMSEDMRHVSLHTDRIGPRGSKKSKEGKRMCHFCSKVESEEEKFRYCGRCKIVSYCRCVP
jgi:hypothetical protein